MHSSKELELHSDAVKITWCSCEICNATGPRSMTLVKNHHEYTVELSSNCWKPGLEDEIVSGEALYVGGHLPLRNQMPR
jgi:hypothetical protein